MNRVAKFSGITNMGQLRKRHTNAYLKSKIDKGCSKNYLVTERFGIRKFEKCMLATGKKSKYDDSFAPDVKLPKESRINPRGRYTQNEYEIIISELKEDFSPEIVRAIEIQGTIGLRISEALKITTNDFNLSEVSISHNIAKGGKDRDIPVYNREHPLIINILANANEEKEKVINIGERRIQQAVREICLENGIEPRGTHGFRGKFANERLKYYCKQYGVEYDIKHLRDDPVASLTKAEKQVLMRVSKDLGHERISIIRKYYLHR